MRRCICGSRRTGRSYGRQREDCLAHAARLGLSDPLIFVDNDVSAFDGGRRAGYDALVREVAAGVTHVVVWHVDRLYRRPQGTGGPHRPCGAAPGADRGGAGRWDGSEHRGGAVDDTPTGGRRRVRVGAQIRSCETRHPSSSRTGGRAWSGTLQVWAGWVLIPDQAAVIREMTDQFLNGQSLRSIDAWLNRANIPPSLLLVGSVLRPHRRLVE